MDLLNFYISFPTLSKRIFSGGIDLENWSKPDSIFLSDSSLTGIGGFWNGCYFHAQFPESIIRKCLHIGVLEILSIIICLKLWGKYFKGQRIVVFCDNLNVCHLLNHGNSRSEILQDSLREICYLAACNEFELRAQHLSSEENRISDVLSRYTFWIIFILDLALSYTDKLLVFRWVLIVLLLLLICFYFAMKEIS